MSELISFGLGFLVSSAIWLVTHDFKLDWKHQAMKWKKLVDEQEKLITKNLEMNQKLIDRLGEE